MALTTNRRLIPLFIGTILAALFFCVVGYLFAVKIGITEWWAGLWALTTFFICATASWNSMQRVLRNANPHSMPILPQPSVGATAWIAGGFIIPMLASVFHLGTGFLLIPVLALIQSAGVPIDPLIAPFSWFALAFSVGGAIGVWLLIWSRYKRSRNPDIQ